MPWIQGIVQCFYRVLYGIKYVPRHASVQGPADIGKGIDRLRMIVYNYTRCELMIWRRREDGERYISKPANQHE